MRKAIPVRAAAVGFEECDPGDATHLQLRLPGPIPHRILPVILAGRREGTGRWSWNGSVDFPTLRPSVLTWQGQDRCHTWINDGLVQFLPDSTHALTGQTMELFDVDVDINERGC